MKNWFRFTSSLVFCLLLNMPVFAQTLAQRLGYPADAKLIIVHADDLGETHAVNAAAIMSVVPGDR